jgi:hypothetical protein
VDHHGLSLGALMVAIATTNVHKPCLHRGKPTRSRKVIDYLQADPRDRRAECSTCTRSPGNGPWPRRVSPAGSGPRRGLRARNIASSTRPDALSCTTSQIPAHSPDVPKSIDGHRTDCDILIGADGARSVVRSMLTDARLSYVATLVELSISDVDPSLSAPGTCGASA